MALTLADIRKKYPQYDSISDEDLADRLYKKFYEGKIDPDEFRSKIGLTVTQPAAEEPEQAPEPEQEPESELVQEDDKNSLGQRVRRAAAEVGRASKDFGLAFASTTTDFAAGVLGLGSELIERSLPGIGDVLVGRGSELSKVVPGTGARLTKPVRKFEEVLSKATETLRNALSPETAAAIEKQAFTRGANNELQFGEAWKDPNWYIYQVGSLAATTVPGIGIGGLSARATYSATFSRAMAEAAKKQVPLEIAEKAARQKAKEAAIKTSVIVAGGAEGAVAAGMSFNEIQDRINQLDEETMMNYEPYRRLRENGMSHEAARSSVASDQAVQGGLVVGAVTGVLGVPFNALMGRWFSGLSGGRFVEAAKGFVTEAPTEFLQGGAEQYISNLQMKPITPELNEWEGVLESALTEGILGGGFGAGVGAVVGGERKPPTHPQVTEGLKSLAVARTNYSAILEAAKDPAKAIKKDDIDAAREAYVNAQVQLAQALLDSGRVNKSGQQALANALEQARAAGVKIRSQRDGNAQRIARARDGAGPRPEASRAAPEAGPAAEGAARSAAPAQAGAAPGAQEQALLTGDERSTLDALTGVATAQEVDADQVDALVSKGLARIMPATGRAVLLPAGKRLRKELEERAAASAAAQADAQATAPAATTAAETVAQTQQKQETVATTPQTGRKVLGVTKIEPDDVPELQVPGPAKRRDEAAEAAFRQAEADRLADEKARAWSAVEAARARLDAATRRQMERDWDESDREMRELRTRMNLQYLSDEELVAAGELKPEEARVQKTALAEAFEAAKAKLAAREKYAKEALNREFDGTKIMDVGGALVKGTKVWARATEIGALKIAQGAVTLAQWTERMATDPDIPARIRRELPKIAKQLFADAKRLFQKMGSPGNRRPKPPRKGMLRFRHWSKKPNLKVLDPKFAGTGTPGAERRRGGATSLSFYGDQLNEEQPEKIVTANAPFQYEVEVPADRMYDMDADPLGLKDEHRTSAGVLVLDDLEDELKDRGYWGWFLGDREGQDRVLANQARIWKKVKATPVAVPPGIALAASRDRPGSDVGHKREKTTGRYVGAPDWVGSTPQNLTRLRKTLRSLAREGSVGRFWYEKSSRAILEMVNGNKREAELIVSLIAIYSPNATVPANTTMALTAYYQWKAGLPINAGFESSDEKAENLLRHNKPWSGIKTNSFYQNLMVEIDPSKLDPGVATMDMWMALAFDYGYSTIDQGPKYQFMLREINAIADEMGIPPHQAQASIWTAIKGRIDPIRKKLRERELKLGIGEIVEKINKKTGKKEKVYQIKKGREYDHFRLAHKMGMEYEPTPQDFERAAVDFSDVIRSVTAIMGWEAQPGRTTGILPGMFEAPIEQRAEYLIAVARALTDKDGTDLIADAVGAPSGQTVFGYSAWEGNIGAGATTFLPVAMEGQKKDRKVKDPAYDLMNLYSAMRGYVLSQDSVVWHVPVYDDAKIRHNGVDLRGKRPLNQKEMETLYRALHDEFGTWAIAPGYTPDGVRILSFVKEVDPKRLKQGISNIVAKLPSDFAGGDIVATTYRSTGEMISNDWKENPNGKTYLDIISARGTDLLRRATELRARVAAVNRRFSEKFGWGDPGPDVTVPTKRALSASREEQIPDFIDVDGKQRPTRDANGQLLFTDVEGIRNFWRWFGDSKVVDEAGRPLVLFHGTTRDFTQFDFRNMEVGSNVGAGIYMSNSIDDVNINYAGIGADLEAKIFSVALEIFYKDTIPGMPPPGRRGDPSEGDPAFDAAMDIARERLIEQEGAVLPLYVRMQKPAILGSNRDYPGARGTFMPYVLRETGDEEFEVDENASKDAIAFIESLINQIIDNANGTMPKEVDRIEQIVMDFAIENGGIDITNLWERLNDQNEFWSVGIDQNGNWIGAEMIRRALQDAGFDGIIDRSVDMKFGSGRPSNSRMRGVTPETVHYVSFSPSSVKSAVGNNGQYDPRNPNITMSSGSGRGNMTVNSVRSAISNVVKQLGIPIQIFATQRDLPAEVTSILGGRGYVEGFFEEGPNGTRVAIAADAMLTAGHAVETYLHEVVGHFGLRGLLKGHDYQILMMEIYQNFSEGVVLAAERNRIDLTKPGIEGVQNIMLAAEEFVAYQAGEFLRKHGALYASDPVSRFIRWMTNKLRKFGFLKQSREEFLIDLILRSRDYVISGRAKRDRERRRIMASYGKDPDAPPRLAENQPLHGMPTSVEIPGIGRVQVRPFQPARDAAEAYAKEAGIDYRPPLDYVRVNPERGRRIAEAFERMEHAPNDPRVRESYEALAKETLAQYQFVKATGLRIEFIKPGQPDPYAASPRLAIQDVIENNHLWVFPTDLGYGTEGIKGADAGSPMLRETDERIDGRVLLVNDVFRIVHDYFGHIKEGVGFRADGEENAWRQHMAMFSPLAQAALTTETRGQNSWVNWGPYGEQNRKAGGGETVYAEQKLGILPDEFLHDTLDATDRLASVGEDTEADEGDPTQNTKAISLFHPNGMGGVPNNQEVERRSFTRLMTADDFLRLAPMLGQPRRGSLDAMRQHAQSGGKFGNPFLTPEWDAVNGVWRVQDSDHDGRHRATVAMEMFGEDAVIPVHIFPKGMRSSDLTEEQINAPIVFGSITSDAEFNRTLDKMFEEAQLPDPEPSAAISLAEERARRQEKKAVQEFVSDLRGNVASEVQKMAREVNESESMFRFSPGDRVRTNSGEIVTLGPRILRPDLRLPAKERRRAPRIPAYFYTKQTVNGEMSGMIGDFELAEKMSGPTRVITGGKVMLSAGTGNPDLDSFIAKIGTKRLPLSVRWQQWKANLKDRMIMAALDHFHGIARAEQIAGIAAGDSGYISARLSTGAASVVSAVLEYGYPVWDGGAPNVAGNHGFFDILKPLGNDVDAWARWMVARRAKRLMAEGRENLFTKAEINAALATGDGRQDFLAAAQAYADFKRKVLDFAQDAGIIDPNSRALWENDDHIPFYRLMENGEFKAGSAGGGIGFVRNQIRRLRGGEQNIGDPLENIITNWSNLIESAIKAHAARVTVDNLDGTGLVEKIPNVEFTRAIVPKSEIKKFMANNPEIVRDLAAVGLDVSMLDSAAFEGMQQMLAIKPPEGENIISIWRDGKREYYRVHDPLLFRSMQAINPTVWSNWMNILRMPKRVLTKTVTVAPDFIIRNVARDMMSVFVQGRHDKAAIPMIPIIDTVKGVAEFLRDGDVARSLRAGGASFEGSGFNPETAAQSARRAARRAGLVHMTLDSPAKLYDAYMKMSNAAENAHRVAIYNSAIRAGKSRKEALYEAKDVMDFSLRGNSAAARFLVETVPFWGARVQGLYRLGRAVAGNPVGVALRGLVVTTITLAIFAGNHDDERYKALPENEKNMYWHLFDVFREGDHIRIPKPFEVGVIFGTIPEAILDAMVTNADEPDAAKQSLKLVGHAFGESLSLYPQVATVWPLFELAINRNTFTGAPILTQGDEGVLPQEQDSPSVRPTYRLLARLMPEYAPEALQSPKKLQHLGTGYIGTLQDYALFMADPISRAILGEPTPPEKASRDYPFLRSFYRTGPERATKYGNMLHQIASESEKVYRSINRLAQQEGTGAQKRIMELATEKEDLLAVRDTFRKAAEQVIEIRRKQRVIQLDREMTPDEKRQAIDELQSVANEIAREVWDLRPGGKLSPSTAREVLGKTKDQQAAALRRDGLRATAALIDSIPPRPTKNMVAAFEGLA